MTTDKRLKQTSLANVTKTNKTQNLRPYAPWAGYISWPKDVRFFSALAELDDDVESNVSYLVRAAKNRGLRLSLQHHVDDNVWDVGLYGAWMDSDAPGWMLNVRHRDYARALTALRALDEHVFAGAWPLNGMAHDYDY